MNGVVFFLLLATSLAYLSRADVAKLTLLPHAVDMGAMCLDGSPPGYYYRAGSGSGTSSWIVHLEGGGWCYDEDACIERSKTSLGSSKSWVDTATFHGFLSDDKTSNPDFYNWNVVYAKYCDGASFAGSVDHVVIWKGTSLYFRGLKVLEAILDSVLAIGMSQAKEVILTGCSAGGLATYLHADMVQQFVPKGVAFHAFADAGYFIDAPNVTEQMHIQALYQYVFKMQNVSMGVNQDCLQTYTALNEPWRCFFPEFSFPFITSPIFVVNSQYDTWQLGNILQLGCTPPNCSKQQMQYFNNFRDQFLSAAADTIASMKSGVFLDSCLEHCQTLSDATWTEIKVKDQSLNTTFANWYFKRSESEKDVDCAYPCNDSCPK